VPWRIPAQMSALGFRFFEPTANPKPRQSVYYEHFFLITLTCELQRHNISWVFWRLASSRPIAASYFLVKRPGARLQVFVGQQKRSRSLAAVQADS